MHDMTGRGTTRRAPLLLAALASLVLTLAGCGSKEPGEDAVATVDGYEITLAEFNHELAESGVRDSENPAARQAALAAIINRKLLSGMAQETELDRTPDYILKEQRMRDVLLADAAVRSLAPPRNRTSDEEIAAFLRTNLAGGSARTIYAVDGLQFARPREAEVMDRLAGAATFEEIQRILSDEEIAARGARLTWDSASLPTEIVRQLSQLPDGEPFLIPEGNGMVAGVIREKRRLALDPAQSRMLAENAVAQQSVRTRVMDWLEQARHSAEIQYGEGFAPDAPAAGEATAPSPSVRPAPGADQT